MKQVAELGMGILAVDDNALILTASESGVGYLPACGCLSNLSYATHPMTFTTGSLKQPSRFDESLHPGLNWYLMSGLSKPKLLSCGIVMKFIKKRDRKNGTTHKHEKGVFKSNHHFRYSRDQPNSTCINTSFCNLMSRHRLALSRSVAYNANIVILLNGPVPRH